MKDRKSLIPSFEPIPIDNLDVKNTIRDQMQPILDAEALLNDVLDRAEEAKQYLLDIVEAIMSHASPQDEWKELGSLVYWTVSSLDPKEFRTLCGMATKNVWRVPSDVLCDECSRALMATSHTHLKELRAIRGKVYCSDCEESRTQAARLVASKLAEVEKNTGAKVLETMPYDEYLQTTEWQERRKEHLKAAGYACQLCNASHVELHVHHRTYENRGHEHFNDLIVLCAECHRKHHKIGGDE